MRVTTRLSHSHRQRQPQMEQTRIHTKPIARTTRCGCWFQSMVETSSYCEQTWYPPFYDEQTDGYIMALVQDFNSCMQSLMRVRVNCNEQLDLMRL